jgi:hypothetical protein
MLTYQRTMSVVSDIDTAVHFTKSPLCALHVKNDMQTLGAYRYGHADAAREAAAIIGAHNNLPLIDIEQTVNQNRGESYPICHGTSQRSSPPIVSQLPHKSLTCPETTVLFA